MPCPKCLRHTYLSKAVNLIMLGDICDYINLAGAAAITFVGFFSFSKPLVSMIAPEQVSSFLGIISVAGLAIINVYSFFRSSIRQHNLADAEAMKETLRGKYEAELESKALLVRRIEELQAILNERNEEIDHLRRQLRKPNCS